MHLAGTIHENESYLMWKNYTNFNEGILLLTTVEDLLNALEIKCYENEHEIVKYIYGKIDYDYHNQMNSDHMKAFGKSKYFINENEFRIVMYHHPILTKNMHRTLLKNLLFIKKIICSPGASSEFIELIKKIVMKHIAKSGIVQVSEIKQNNRDILEQFLNETIR